MKFKDKIDIGYKIIKSRFLNKKFPLLVGWSITNRCNLNCIYCGRWSKGVSELKTSEIFSIIDELKKLGTKIISFTGGEPLLRNDITEIIGYAHKNEIHANINTNGTLFLEKIDELNNLDSVKFSLDGPEEVNDYIRGRETFQKVIEAIKAAKNKKIASIIVTVLSKYNLSSIEYLVNLAEDLGIGILFQPLTLTLLSSEIVNPHIPDEREYHNTLARLIEHKKESMSILNTKEELVYLKSWPKDKNIACQARNISCRIETDGYLYHCGRRQNKDTALNCLDAGVKKAFDNLTPISCNHCWCAMRLKMNYIASFDLKSIFSIIGRL